MLSLCFFRIKGQPSGEAFIQMDSEQSAFICASQRHHRYLVINKKQRYIEVFQCSLDDMLLVRPLLCLNVHVLWFNLKESLFNYSMRIDDHVVR